MAVGRQVRFEGSLLLRIAGIRSPGRKAVVVSGVRLRWRTVVSPLQGKMVRVYGQWTSAGQEVVAEALADLRSFGKAKSLLASVPIRPQPIVMALPANDESDGRPGSTDRRRIAGSGVPNGVTPAWTVTPSRLVRAP